MRKVEILKYERLPGIEPHEYGHLSTGEVGLFHGLGVDYEAFEKGVGNYSTAIVEMPDGTIRTPYILSVRFLKEDVTPEQEEDKCKK